MGRKVETIHRRERRGKPDRMYRIDRIGNRRMTGKRLKATGVFGFGSGISGRFARDASDLFDPVDPVNPVKTPFVSAISACSVVKRLRFQRKS
ncbi:MAG: hypothetical protein AB1512_14580 [Thermodesulfobacteriota bacterium]